MNIINSYIEYIRNVRRYSERTACIYEQVLMDFASNIKAGDDESLLAALNVAEIRSFEVYMMDEKKLSAKTVNLHISVLSGFCRYLIKINKLQSNPVLLLSRPKLPKRLPGFYKGDTMAEYFDSTSYCATAEELEAFKQAPFTEVGKQSYEQRLARLIINIFYCLGIRRTELLGLTIGSVDFGRNVVKVHGKGDKMREIPLLASLSEEILLYLEAVEVLCARERSLTEPLLVTYGMKPLYPVYVDRVVKSELGRIRDITGRKSPHVLRHSLATDLLNDGSDLNSIKEMLGHSSLATTQIYTHSNIAQLSTIYKQAHPRSKNGGKHGD